MRAIIIRETGERIPVIVQKGEEFLPISRADMKLTTTPKPVILQEFTPADSDKIEVNGESFLVRSMWCHHDIESLFLIHEYARITITRETGERIPVIVQKGAAVLPISHADMKRTSTPKPVILQEFTPADSDRIELNGKTFLVAPFGFCWDDWETVLGFLTENNTQP